MMDHRALALTVLLVVTSPLVAADPVPVWPNGVPNSKGEGEGHSPSLTWYPAPEKNNTGACVVVLPGGGYNNLADRHEGHQIVQWLNGLGINAYIHRYRLKPQGYTPADSLLDALQAMRLARQWAPEKGYDPNRIGILGFSAGGHLSSMTTLTSAVGSTDAGPTDEEKAARPDFAILLYPAYLYVFPEAEYGVPPKPNKNVPPIFIAVSGQDPKYEMTSAKIFENFKPAGVDVELHAFGGWGPHGLGLAHGDPAFGQWPGMCHAWMRRQGLLTSSARCASATLNMTNCDKKITGWARLSPIGDNNKPVVAVSSSNGVFKFNDVTTRPCPGDYTLSLYIAPEKPELGMLPMDPVSNLTLTITPGDNVIDIADFRLKTEESK